MGEQEEETGGGGIKGISQNCGCVWAPGRAGDQGGGRHAAAAAFAAATRQN